MTWTQPISPWTLETVEKLRSLHATGMSMSKMAAELGNGLTRNAVVGKIHRLRMPKYGKPSGQSRPKEKTPPRPPIERRGPAKIVVGIPVEPLPTFEPLPAISNPVAFLDARHGQCRYPLWDDATPLLERVVCGAPTIHETSWCRSCFARISHVKVSRPKQAAAMLKHHAARRKAAEAA